jgi:hypothetical protein
VFFVNSSFPQLGEGFGGSLIAFRDDHLSSLDCPANRQHLTILHLLHRRIRRVTIHYQDRFVFRVEVVLGHLVAATRVENEHHRVLAEEHLHPPTIAHFACFLSENEPSRFVGLMVLRPPIAIADQRVDRREQRRQSLQSRVHCTRRNIQTHQRPSPQQPLDRRMAPVLREHDLDPHRGAEQTLGDPFRS